MHVHWANIRNVFFVLYRVIFTENDVFIIFFLANVYHVWPNFKLEKHITAQKHIAWVLAELLYPCFGR